MSKGLEAWERIKEGIDTNVWKCGYWDDIELIEKCLNRLEKIDDLFEEIGIDEKSLPIWYEMQKEDGKKVKALEIIKEKRVDIGWLIRSENHSKYNLGVGESQALKKEEYDLLKEVCVNANH